MAMTLVTVVETNAYLAKARPITTEEERTEIVTVLAANPALGALVPEGGGIRKVRFAGKGRGKRGGVRVIYYYRNVNLPLYLLTILAKNERSDLAKSEVHLLARAVKQIC
jgi:hypothetical protein